MNSNAKVHELDAELFELLLVYVSETAHSEKLAEIIAAISRCYPEYLRVKELFETMEAYRRIGQDIYEQWRAGHIRTIYDLACGHGLLGILLAWRFRKLQVVCVDLEERPAFACYLDVAERLGAPLENITYIESDLADIAIPPGSYIVCIHGCNEATQMALQKANHANACYAAMPCCIRDGIYLRRIKHVDDQIRYAASVGVIAGQFGAYKITAIDECITNRNLIILGAGGEGCV